MYSFKKGSMPYNKLYIGNVENSSYNAELKGITYNALIKQLQEYGNIEPVVSGSLKDTLNVRIADYSRSADTYDTQGNILGYSYSFLADFNVSGKMYNIRAVKLFSKDIDEPSCQDSVANEAVKLFLDRLRGDF